MESCMQFIPRKSYNTYGYVVLALFFLTAVTLIGITSDLNAKSILSCNPGENVAVDIRQKTFVETTCSLKYEQKYNSPVPFNGFVIHLVFARLLPMILFVVLVLYPADFPTNFSCPWPFGTSSKVNITAFNKQFNLTIVDCKNPLGSKSISFARAVRIVDIIFSLVTLVEAVYLVWRNCKDKYFARDIVFCSVYLLGKRKTIRKIINNKTPCRRSLGLHGIGEWAVEWPMQCGDVACWETVCYADCLGGEY